MLQSRNFWISLLVVLILVITLGLIFDWRLWESKSAATNFRTCVLENGLILESYPRQCRTNTGTTFTEDIGNTLAKVDLITIEAPRPGQTVTSPLTIVGQARGYWFFEASFPVVLTTVAGQVIATGYAEALREWMTSDFVPFKAELVFEPGTEASGILVLQKDNPSGLPEHADEVWFPVAF